MKLSDLILKGAKMSRFGSGVMVHECGDGSLECCAFGAAAHAKLGNIRKDRINRIEENAQNLVDHYDGYKKEAQKIAKILGVPCTDGITVSDVVVRANDFSTETDDPRPKIAKALKKVGL